MKKFLTVIFSLILIFTMALFCYAADEEVAKDESVTDDFNLEDYIKDRIAPVLTGVLTSAVTVCLTLAQILKLIKSLKGSKDLLEASKEQIEKVSKSTEGQIADIKEEIKKLSSLFGDFNSLKEVTEKCVGEIDTLARILTLAYSADDNLVRCGKAKEMALLLAKAEEGITNGEEKN